jgi:hypothetical protein
VGLLHFGSFLEKPGVVKSADILQQYGEIATGWPQEEATEV